MTKRLTFYLLILGMLASALAWQAFYPVNKEGQPDNAGLLPLTREVLTAGPLRGSDSGQPAGLLTEEGVLEYTNNERKRFGASTLQKNELLRQAAQKKLDDMLEHQYFDHIAPDGTGPADLADTVGYAYMTVGENLALGNFASDQDLVQAWMDSPGHRENILSGKFKEIGIAVGRGVFEGRETWLAVQSFGTSASFCPTPNPELKETVSSLAASIDSIKKEMETLDAGMQQKQLRQKSIREQIDRKAKAGNEKIQEGNKNMEEGNRIYQETQSEEQAEPYWTKGKALQEEGNKLINEANALIAQLETVQAELKQETNAYNDKVRDINAATKELARLSERYNRAARTFNNCARKLAD